MPLLLLLLLSLSQLVCAEIRLLDDNGDELVLAQPAQRIISLAPNITEVLFHIGAGAQIGAFTPVLVDILNAAAAVEGVVLTSVNYSGTRDARINLSAPDFQSVEQLLDQLDKRSLSAELENSNARQDGVMARLKVEI